MLQIAEIECLAMHLDPREIPFHVATQGFLVRWFRVEQILEDFAVLQVSTVTEHVSGHSCAIDFWGVFTQKEDVIDEESAVELFAVGTEGRNTGGNVGFDELSEFQGESMGINVY